MTVLFNDIRSFTLLSERMSPDENFAFINDYLKYMYPPISTHGGFVDKYIGDAVMALFYHPRDAIEAGIGMHKSLIEFNKIRVSEKKAPIEIGIGLHCGKLMLGVIGVEYRMQGTVISSSVNLASHLEALSKFYGSALIISQDILADNKELYPTRHLGKVKIAEKKIIYMEIYEILSAEREDIFVQKMASKPFFEAGVELYYAKRFTEASVQFSQGLNAYPKDKAGMFYLKQCAANMIVELPESWDGTNFL